MGGWGLQTLLHLHQRLNYVQEQREALDLVYSPNILSSNLIKTGAAAPKNKNRILDHQHQPVLPDLGKITAFAGLVPNTSYSDDQSPFYYFTPILPKNPKVKDEPYIVENWLKPILEEYRPEERAQTAEEKKNPQSGFILDSQSGIKTLECEHIAEALLKNAKEAGWCRQIKLHKKNLNWPVNERVSRHKMMQASLMWADEIAGVFDASILDKTRYDIYQPHDPHVRTRLYVIASLSEPLTSVFICPIIASLVSRLGGNDIAKVVGVFH